MPSRLQYLLLYRLVWYVSCPFVLLSHLAPYSCLHLRPESAESDIILSSTSFQSRRPPANLPLSSYVHLTLNSSKDRDVFL